MEYESGMFLIRTTDVLRVMSLYSPLTRLLPTIRVECGTGIEMRSFALMVSLYTGLHTLLEPLLVLD